MDEILWLLEQAMRDLQAARRRAGHRGKPADNARSPSNRALCFALFSREHNFVFYVP